MAAKASRCSSKIQAATQRRPSACSSSSKSPVCGSAPAPLSGCAASGCAACRCACLSCAAVWSPDRPAGWRERLAGAGGVHRQFAADRRRHAHQRRTLHLIDDDRPVLAGIQHRRLTVSPDSSIRRRSVGCTIASRLRLCRKLLPTTKACEPMVHRPDRRPAHESLLLHGGEQAVSGGIRQAGLLRQIGQRHVALSFEMYSNSFRPRVNDCAAGRRTGGRGCCAGFLPRLAGAGVAMGEIPFPYDGIHFRFVDELQVATSSSEVLAHNLKNSQLSSPLCPYKLC